MPFHKNGNRVLLDGATGTQLQGRGLPTGHSPELWVLDHPSTFEALQDAYLAAGSQVLFTPTFGANRIKLAPFGVGQADVEAINRDLAALSVGVKQRWLNKHPHALVQVAGDLAPTGHFLKPAGSLSFDALVEVYREQVRGLLQAGVDCFVAETMMDLAQARAAVLAVRSECQLPVFTSMTVEAHGRTLSGQKPQECLLSLAAAGASVFGLNCSAGPQALADWLLPLQPWTPVPLLIKPNAGLPELVDGQTVFPMQAEPFAQQMQAAMAGGITFFGGCCGTGPDHIRALDKALQATPNQAPAPAPETAANWICSSRSTLDLSQPHRQARVLAHTDTVIDDCLDLAADADLLLLDYRLLALEQLDQATDTLEEIQLMVPNPLAFQSDDPAVLYQLLRHYHGRAGVHTAELKVLPFGARFVALS